MYSIYISLFCKEIFHIIVCILQSWKDGWEGHLTLSQYVKLIMEGWILILRSAEIFNYITHIHSLIAFKVKFILHSHKYMHKFLEIIECYTQELFVQIIPFKNIVESLINWLTHALNSILGVQWFNVSKGIVWSKRMLFFFFFFSRPVFWTLWSYILQNKIQRNRKHCNNKTDFVFNPPTYTIFHFHSFY